MAKPPPPSDRLDELDYYTLLGVSDDADAADLRRAFRKFARKYHPDRFVGAPREKIERAQQIYRRGSEGIQVLTDATSRRAYDEALQRGELRLSVEQALAAAVPKPKRKKPPPPIQSPVALAYYKKAAVAAEQRDWRNAWRALKAAVDIEPNNALILTRLEQVEARLRSSR